MQRLRAAVALALVSSVVVALPADAAVFAPSEWVIGPLNKVAVITLDGQTKTPLLLDTLAMLEQRSARVSFFMSGAWIAHHRDKAELIDAAGHQLGNRGWGTRPFTELGDGKLRWSIRKATDALRSVGAYPRPFLRAPKGKRDVRVLRIAGSMGYRSVRWTDRPGAGLADKIRRRVLRRAQRGSIISLDLWRKSHRNALPGIIDGLRRKGYKLRTLDALTHAHAVRWDVTLRAGASGREVRYLDKRLRALTYPAGAVDGEFDYPTLQAVYAFEKTHGSARDGVVTPAQMTSMSVARRPRAPKRAPKDFVDVDISRQVLFEVRDGRVKRTLPISSGNEEYYTVDGQTYKAHTPRGAFSVERKIAGRRVSRLGVLWWPNYFVGGYAIHGSDSVPTYPASHGCVRIPRYVERGFFDRNPIGMPVFVHD